MPTHNGVVPPQNAPVRFVFSQNMGAQPLQARGEGRQLVDAAHEQQRAASGGERRRQVPLPPDQMGAAPRSAGPMTYFLRTSMSIARAVVAMRSSRAHSRALCRGPLRSIGPLRRPTQVVNNAQGSSARRRQAAASEAALVAPIQRAARLGFACKQPCGKRSWVRGGLRRHAGYVPA